MAGIPFTISAFSRDRGALVAAPLVNMFPEAVPTEEKGIALQSRPGLTDRAKNMGDGPVKALFREDGVLGGKLYGISNRRLYEGTTEIGLTTGNAATSIAGYADRIFTAAGNTLKTYDGETLETVAFPDGAKVIKVLVAASRLIAIRADTQKYYWSDPLDADVPALNFASAESQPDRLRDALFVDNMLVLFGARTVEFHYSTGDADAPFKPLLGREYSVGIKQTGACAKLTEGFAWAGHDNVIYLGGQAPQRISFTGLEEKIAASASVQLFTFRIEGTEFLAVRVDAGTWAYSTVAQAWMQLVSDGYSNWVPQCWADGVFGSAVDGRTMEFGEDWADLGGTLERRFRAGYVINGAPVTINNLSLRCNPGQTGFTTGTYADPTVELRISWDGGQTFEFFAAESMGVQGDYRAPVRWAGLGMAGYPGLLAEFRCADPVDFRVSDVRANEPWSGR